MFYFLVLLYTVVLLLRPQEFMGGLQGLPLLQVTLLGGMGLWLSVPHKGWEMPQFKLVGPFLLIAAFGMGLNGWWGGGVLLVQNVLPSILTAVLLSGGVRSLSQLRGYLSLVIGIACVIVLHGYLQLKTGTGWTGSHPIEGRITYSGIFDDPNDLGLLLVIAIAAVTYLFGQTRQGGYVRDMQAYRPRVLVGYGAPVVRMARWLQAHGERIESLRGVITGSEALYEPERIEIERAFGVPVTNTYGSREVMLMASECERHSGLHVHMDHLVLETVDGQDRGVSGESGEVLVTDLHNYGMPMVRYANGDRATRSTAACDCGRELPLLASIDGRVLETIVTPDGRILPGIFFVHTMVDFPRVRQYLVVQTAADVAEMQLVVEPPLSPDERERLRERLQRTAGESMRIELREVQSIAPLPSGKRRVTVALART